MQIDGIQIFTKQNMHHFKISQIDRIQKLRKQYLHPSKTKRVFSSSRNTALKNIIIFQNYITMVHIWYSDQDIFRRSLHIVYIGIHIEPYWWSGGHRVVILHKYHEDWEALCLAYTVYISWIIFLWVFILWFLGWLHFMIISVFLEQNIDIKKQSTVVMI